jgi:hypothetical protein
MPAPKCPFQTPIIGDDFACSLAQPVTARNTPQIHCRSESALALCQRVYEHLKAVGLPALGLEDDLATTPHNAYLKVQMGGLLGLQAMSGGETKDRIADLRQLIAKATEDGARVDALPYPELVPHILAQKSKRRRERRK